LRLNDFLLASLRALGGHSLNLWALLKNISS
jgi:hypothetical protein